MSGRTSRTPIEWVLITSILLVAALLRFHDLGNIPKGLEHDEVATWHMVTQVLEGQRPIYFEEGYGHEPLFNYLTALPMALFGHNWLGERFWAPWLGLGAVAATYALMRRMFDPVVGLGAAGLQGTVLWALFFNRLGLRLNQLPFLLCVAMYAFWRGLELTVPGLMREAIQAKMRRDIDDGVPEPINGRTRWAWFAAAGALMGLSLYTYMSSRVIPLLFGTFSLYLVARDLWRRGQGSDTRSARPRPWRSLLGRWGPLVVCFVVAALVMAPLVLYLLDRPVDTTIPQREGQVDRPLRELRQGNLRPVLENAWGLIGMWNADGERYWQLNYSHRPVFVEPISGILFWVGALIVLWRWKEPRMAALGLWVGLGMVPSLITSEAPSWPRTMLASPAALAFPAIAISTMAAKLPLRGETRYRLSLVLLGLLALSVLLNAALTYRDLLVLWPRHPRVRYAFQSSLTEALRYLDGTDDPTPVVMAGLSPHDMDPWTERSTLRRRDLSIRWVDTRTALVLPQGDEARLIALDITPIDPALSRWAGLTPAVILGQGELVQRSGSEDESDAPPYVGPAYVAYRLNVAALRQRIQAARHGIYVGSEALSPAPLDQAPEFGGLVRLVGYEWLGISQAGAPAQLLTFWLALETGSRGTLYGEPALRTFFHLLDGGQIVSGVDVLGAAPDTWLPGDVIVQLHAFVFPRVPGLYVAELGWYVPPDGPRLSVDGVDAPGERILLEPVEVEG